MLFVYLYDNDLTSPSYEADLSLITSGISILWELHGGVRTIEFDVMMSMSSAFNFYSRYLGYRVIILDNALDIPVADCFITGLSITTAGVRVVANGAWFRHSDQLYNFDDIAKLDHVGALSYTAEGADSSFTDLGQTFTTYGSSGGVAIYEIWIVNDDDTVSWAFIDTVVSPTEVTICKEYNLITTGWNGKNPFGKTPASYEVILSYNYKTTSEILEDSLSEVPLMSSDYSNIDESNTIIGFWSPPIEDGGLYPAETIDKLASFSDSTNRQWNYLAQAQPVSTLTPNKPVAHFEAQVDDGTYDWEIKVEMIDGDAAAERNIQELRNDIRVAYKDFENDGVLMIEPVIGGGALTDSDSQDKYWLREAIISGGDADSDLASAHGQLYLDKYKDAMFSKSVTVSSLGIRDSRGTNWPLWYPIKMGTSYFRISDMYADPITMVRSLDRTLVSQASTMEYDADTNKLRIVLDTEDDSLDAMLARMDAFG